MDEKEFKKLASNSRDWLIYQLLSERSKETVEKEIKSEHVSGVSFKETANYVADECVKEWIEEEQTLANVQETTQEIVWKVI